MKVFIGFRSATTDVIEWADINKKKPVAFFIICPYCNYKQWNTINNFYTAFDLTKNNLKCKKCGCCKSKLGSYRQRKMETELNFMPKLTGWTSISKSSKTQ